MTQTRKSSKVSEDEDQLFRLTNIRPNENSVVDHPANLRDWVLTKSEAGMTVLENADGSITVKKEEEVPGGPPGAPAAAETPEAPPEAPPEEPEAEKAGVDAALREMGEKMLEMAEALKGADALDEEQMQTLQLLAEELMGMLKRTDEPTTKNAKDLVSSFHADLVSKAGSMKALHLAESVAATLLGMAKSEKASKTGHPAVATLLKMRAITRVVDTIITKAKGKDDMDDDETKKTDAPGAPEEKPTAEGESKFSAEVLGKLLHSIGEINATMKAMGIGGGLSALYGVAKSDPNGGLIVKSLDVAGVGAIAKSVDPDLAAQFASMQKRMIAIESAGDSKSLPGSGSNPVSKNDDSLFKGLV